MKRSMLLAAGFVALVLGACASIPTQTPAQVAAAVCPGLQSEVALLQSSGVFTGGAQATLTNQIQLDLASVCAVGATVTQVSLQNLVNATFPVIVAAINVSSLTDQQKLQATLGRRRAGDGDQYRAVAARCTYHDAASPPRRSRPVWRRWPPIRVAFSGSGFKVPAHVGALQAIADAGFTPVELAGTSGGSICAALAACGMSLSDMKTLALTHDWSNMMSFSPLSVLRMKGFCDGRNLLAWMREHTGGKTFAGTGIELKAVASNVANEGAFEFSRTATPDVPVALAVRSSTSIPFVFEPVTIGGALLADGGMVNNIPGRSTDG